MLRHTVYHISLDRLDHESAKIKLRDLKKSQKREKKVTAEKKPVYSIANLQPPSVFVLSALIYTNP